MKENHSSSSFHHKGLNQSSGTKSVNSGTFKVLFQNTDEFKIPTKLEKSKVFCEINPIYIFNLIYYIYICFS